VKLVDPQLSSKTKTGRPHAHRCRKKQAGETRPGVRCPKPRKERQKPLNPPAADLIRQGAGQADLHLACVHAAMYCVLAAYEVHWCCQPLLVLSTATGATNRCCRPHGSVLCSVLCALCPGGATAVLRDTEHQLPSSACRVQ
jgi:hypothetical protein